MWQGWHDENRERMRLERELKQMTTLFHRVIKERDSLKQERDSLKQERDSLKQERDDLEEENKRLRKS
jgi:FtsZ-binding cell division protein ZapB